MIGQLFLRRYRVLRQLDEGGMSRVFLGVQTDSPREVAIKVLKPELAIQARFREHFRREIYILSRFQHPHAVAFYEADADARQPVIVMEYLRGLDLLHLLVRSKRLSLERTGRLLGQTCSVLQAAHEEGIVHRDLKPGNLFIQHPDTPQEKVKLMDFGLAKMSSMLYISPEEMANLGQPTASGTPEYISPEQVRGIEVDRRGDLYSLGVVLYEMLTGRRPFESDNVRDLLLAHSDNPPPRFAEVGAADAAPAEVEQLVLDCLAKCPEDRPESAEAVALRFEEALGRKIYEKSVASASGSLSRPAVIIRRYEDHHPDAATSAKARNAVVQQVTAVMPESMALLKLKGFVHDLDGEVLESVPGLIRVRLGGPKKVQDTGGLLGWLGGARPSTATAEPVINMELLMQKPDPSEPSRLTITLQLTAAGGSMSSETRSKCERIGRDLQAYLICGR